MKNTSDVKRNSGADLKAMAEAKFAARQVAQQPKTAREQLDEYKATVRKGLMDFVEVGRALGLISKLGLFKEDGYASFAEFVEGEFQMSRAWAYRQVDAARVVAQLSQVETNDLMVVNQAQALELAPLVRSVEAMAAVVRTARARGPVTADSLKAVRIELFPNPKVIDGELASPAIEAAKTTDLPCEACDQPVPKDNADAAQTRCLACDPDREHFALKVGGRCDTCAQDSAHALAEKTAADMPSSPPADGSSLEAVPTHTVEEPAGDADGMDVGVSGNPQDSPDAGDASIGLEHAPHPGPPAGRPLPSDTAEGTSGSVATDQLGTDLPVAPGETPRTGGVARPSTGDGVGEGPAVSSSPPAAQDLTEGQTASSLGSVLPSAGTGVSPAVGVEEEPFIAPAGSSSTDPASDWMATWRSFVGALESLDVDAVRPMLTDAEIAEMDADYPYIGKRLTTLGVWSTT